VAITIRRAACDTAALAQRVIVRRGTQNGRTMSPSHRSTHRRRAVLGEVRQSFAMSCSQPGEVKA
ncbi:MAG: hypothetical protein M3081_04060, partial [Gemmatimonadota bacterium]|nr:hypothetical protein [Gemmatimonadota bacterium]